MSKIISIGTAVPQYGTPQNNILDFMRKAYQDDTASRKLTILFNHSGINSRHSVLPDFGSEHGNPQLFYPNQILPTLEERLNVYKETALPLAVKAIRNALENLQTTIQEFGVTHLITVTCTGLYAPGLDAEIIEQLDLPKDIFHTSINFMGCNAAFPALKLGDALAATNENARVLIVCVELCTLHFQPKNNHDNLLSNTIFGDGAAAVLLVPEKNARYKNHSGLKIQGFHSELLTRGKDLMAWNITPTNFEMVLDAKVPDFIGEEVEGIVSNAARKLSFEPGNIAKWAVHPGGKKILDMVGKQMQLTETDLKASYKVLANYGNMSSPTILFVLKEILESGIQQDETVFAIGFGPGIGIETALLTYDK
ncbi:MAG: type III polyketide synthase [Prolixibacteraceae bacterium]|jgi:predicted naringenin-chalcone synthase